MQGTIAQIVALTSWGNAALDETAHFDETSFYPVNSTFVFCEYVKFVDLKRSGAKWEENAYASDPVSWLKRIKREGVCTLYLRYGPSEVTKLGNDTVTDRMLVGFVGGGGRWLVEAVKPSGSDYWEARWEVGDQHRKEQKIWQVTYGRIAVDAPSSRPVIEADASTVKAQLAANLSKIAEFGRAHDQGGFAKAFSAALAQLSAIHPLDGLYHTDLAPQNTLETTSAQLLAAAQAAWVFGGMGSWNDIWFEGEDQVQYEELSEELYRLLNTAILVAANSSSRGV